MGNDTKYAQNPLDGFASGCLLDLRMRFAMELLTHSPMYSGAVPRAGDADAPPRKIAEHALDVAAALLDLGAERGLIERLPEAVTPELRAHARRTAAFAALQQVEGQRFMRREQDQPPPQGRRGVPQPGRSS